MPSQQQQPHHPWLSCCSFRSLTRARVACIPTPPARVVPQKLIRYMTQGIDMSAAFVPATKCVALSKHDLPLKKMLYLYLRTAAKQNAAVALLVVQARAGRRGGRAGGQRAWPGVRLARCVRAPLVACPASTLSRPPLSPSQTLLNDCKDLDPTIRGLAVRSMCGLRVPDLMESVVSLA